MITENDIPDIRMSSLLYRRSPEYRITIGNKGWFFVVREADDGLLAFHPTIEYKRPTTILGFDQFRDALVGTEFIVKVVDYRRRTAVEYVQESHDSFMENIRSRI